MKDQEKLVRPKYMILNYPINKLLIIKGTCYQIHLKTTYNMKQIILLSIIVLFSTLTKGQEIGFKKGSIVKMNKEIEEIYILYSDSIEEATDFNNSFRYVQTKDAKLSYKAVRSYSIQNRHYENYSYINSAPKGFLLRILNGPIKLYFYADGSYQNIPNFGKNYVYSNRYYLFVNNELIKVPKSNKKFRKTMTKVLESNPSLVEKINNKELKYSDISSIVRLYNKK